MAVEYDSIFLFRGVVEMLVKLLVSFVNSQGCKCKILRLMRFGGYSYHWICGSLVR